MDLFEAMQKLNEAALQIVEDTDGYFDIVDVTRAFLHMVEFKAEHQYVSYEDPVSALELQDDQFIYTPYLYHSKDMDKYNPDAGNTTFYIRVHPKDGALVLSHPVYGAIYYLNVANLTVGQFIELLRAYLDEN